jgi:hypothetical protein
VCAYDAARGQLTPATFAASVRRVCGIDLAPSVVAVVFAVFDADGDGFLSPAEFFDVLERRRRFDEMAAGGAGGDAAMLRTALSCCADCVARWRDAVST